MRTLSVQEKRIVRYWFMTVKRQANVTEHGNPAANMISYLDTHKLPVTIENLNRAAHEASGLIWRKLEKGSATDKPSNVGAQGPLGLTIKKDSPIENGHRTASIKTIRTDIDTIARQQMFRKQLHYVQHHVEYTPIGGIDHAKTVAVREAMKSALREMYASYPDWIKMID